MSSGKAHLEWLVRERQSSLSTKQIIRHKALQGQSWRSRPLKLYFSPKYI